MKQWEQRECLKCRIRLGCPHSFMAQSLLVEPTEDMKPIIIETMCEKFKMENDDEK